MRLSVSTAVASLFALALAAAPPAGAVPTIALGAGPTKPSQCTGSQQSELSCTAAPGVILTFNVWIHIGTEGMNAYSFGAAWDEGAANELTNVSASITSKTYIVTDPGPPAVTTSYSVDGTPLTITPSSGTEKGTATNWGAISDPTAGTAVYAATAGKSFRVGSITLEVAGEGETNVTPGWFEPNLDAFGGASGQSLTPIFQGALINAPEPTVLLSLLAGVATVAFLGARSRRSD